jgi:hypothetical protein
MSPLLIAFMYRLYSLSIASSQFAGSKKNLVMKNCSGLLAKMVSYSWYFGFDRAVASSPFDRLAPGLHWLGVFRL